MVDLQCLRYFEADFLRIESVLLTKKKGQEGTATVTDYQESMLRTRLLGVAFCRMVCLFWRML